MVENGGNPKTEKRNLVIILATLLVLMITLIVLIIVFRNNKNGSQEQEVDTDGGTLTVALDGSNDEMYLLYEETSKIYDEGRPSEALAIYDQKIEQAVKDSEYETFLRLVSQRDELLVQNSNCSEALNFYDSYNIDGLPAEIQVQYYGTAAGTSAECGDAAREGLYNQKVQQLYDEGKVKDEEEETY